MKKQIPIESILKMHDEEKLNPSQIGAKLGLAKDTVKSHLLKNGRTPYRKAEGIKSAAYEEFIQTIKNDPNTSVTHLRKKLKISHEFANKLIEENKLIVNKMAVRHLSIEEAQSRVPEGEGTVIERMSDGRFMIVAEDGYVYYKTCAKLEQGDPRKMFRQTEEEVRQALRVQGYELSLCELYTKGDKTYVNKKKQVKATCIECGYNRECLFGAYFTNPCSGCVGHGSSFYEEQMVMWLKSLGLEGGKYRFRRPEGSGAGKGMELDFLVAQKNLAIEYCGLYWHNEESKTPRTMNYHKYKMELANSHGIKLITMFEDEWIQKNNIVKNIIKSKLGIFEKRVYARKCKVNEINKEIARVFLRANHLQEAGRIDTAFGLFLDDKLIGVMAASKHHRENGKKNEIVLSRMAFEKGTQVIGGASKLLSEFVKWCKKNEINKIISWSDNRWSEGNVYKMMNFELEDTLPPDYDYVYDANPFSVRVSKQACTKTKLRQLGATEGTESEMAKSLGYKKIWNCGKKRWVYKIPT
jgi:hypothetical protein